MENINRVILSIYHFVTQNPEQCKNEWWKILDSIAYLDLSSNTGNRSPRTLSNSFCNSVWTRELSETYNRRNAIVLLVDSLEACPKSKRHDMSSSSGQVNDFGIINGCYTVFMTDKFWNEIRIHTWVKLNFPSFFLFFLLH